MQTHFSFIPVGSVTLDVNDNLDAHFPLLLLPTKALAIIAGHLSTHEAIQFSTICILLFNLRFKNPIEGILQAQYWRRVPLLDEPICSRIAVQVGVVRRGRENMQSVEGPAGLKALTLHFAYPITDHEANYLILRVKKFTALKVLNIDCRPIGVDALFLLLSAIAQASLPVTHLTLLNLMDNGSTSIFVVLQKCNYLTHLILCDYQGFYLSKEIGKLHHLQSLEICGNTVEREEEDLLLLGQRLTLLPPEIGQLHQLQHAKIWEAHLIALPPEIFHLTSLRSLDIWGPDVNILPSSIGLLHNLTMLTIKGEALAELPDEIGQLASLETLEIWGPWATLPASLGKLSNLLHLHIRANTLQALPPEIGQIGGLQTLDIFGFEDCLPQLPVTFIHLSALKHLTLKVDTLLLPAFMGQFIYLHTLEIATTLPSIPNEIGRLRNLTSLDIVASQLTTLPATIGQLKRLESLSLQVDALMTLPASLGHVECLSTLTIKSLRLMAIPDTINQLARLKNLKLWGTHFTALPDSIVRCRQLQHIDIFGTTLTNVPHLFSELRFLQTFLCMRRGINEVILHFPTSLCAEELEVIRDRLLSWPQQTTFHLNCSALSATKVEDFLVKIIPLPELLDALTLSHISFNIDQIFIGNLLRFTSLRLLKLLNYQGSIPPREIGFLVGRSLPQREYQYN